MRGFRNRTGDTADDKIGVGVFPAEDGVNLDHVALPGQRLQIVRDREQIHLRRKFVLGMTPVPIREDSKLATLHKTFQLLLNSAEIRRRVVRPRAQAHLQSGSRGRICLESGNHVDPIERMQMVEMHDVVMHILRGNHQIADELRILRDHIAECVFDSPDRGDAVDDRADAAETLCKRPRIPGITSLQDQFDAAHHRA